MEVMDLLRERKSVRTFLDKKIDDDIKDLLYEAAFEAPTAGCQMFYSIIEVKDERKKEVLAKACDSQMWLAKAPLVLVFVADNRRWNDLYRAYGLKPREPRLGDLWLALSDANIAAENMVIAAESLGLGSCYIGDVIERHEIVKDLLELPDEVVPACMLVIGYPDAKAKDRTKPRRFAKGYIVHQDAYHIQSADDHKKYYEGHFIKTDKEIDYKDTLKKFMEFKYESDFSKEMSRSARLYFAPFLKDE